MEARDGLREFVDLNPDHFRANFLRLRGLVGGMPESPPVMSSVRTELKRRRSQVQVPEGWKIEPEYYEAYMRWKRERSPEALEDLVDLLEPLIERSIYQYIGSREGSRDMILRMKGRAILQQAIPKYDPTRSSMSTFAHIQLQSLQREYRRQMLPLRIPERQAIEATRLHRAEEELTSRLGRPPSDVELADYTGMSLQKIRHLRGGGSVVAHGRFMESEGAPTESAASARTEAWLEYIYHDLNERDKVIFEHTVGYNGKPKLSGRELAKKLGVSPAYISQRRAEIQRRIDRIRNVEGF